MMRRAKRISTLVLAATLACSMLVLPEAYAANGVKTEEKCTLEVNCNIQVNPDTLKDIAVAEKFEDLNNNSVIINIYRVAEIEVTGKYKPVNGFETLSALESVNSDTTAEKWQELAVKAKELVTEEKLTKTAKAMDGSVKFEDLETGMYLIDAQRLLTPEHRYEFTPYLVSLPNNYYYTENNDTWDYDLINNDSEDEGFSGTTNHAVGLKPASFDRYGYLKIEKDVPTLNIENPGEVFAYEVTAKVGDGVVYNDVVAIDYNEKHSVIVGPIVAGASVTVEEIYMGGSYVQVSTGVPEVAKIQAEECFDECATIEKVEEVAGKISESNIENPLIFKFTNEHNNVPNGATGVVNAISSTGMTQDYQGQNVAASNLPE